MLNVKKLWTSKSDGERSGASWRSARERKAEIASQVMSTQYTPCGADNVKVPALRKRTPLADCFRISLNKTHAILTSSVLGEEPPNCHLRWSHIKYRDIVLQKLLCFDFKQDGSGSVQACF